MLQPRVHRQKLPLQPLALLLLVAVALVLPGWATLVSAADPLEAQDKLALLDVKKALLTSADSTQNLEAYADVQRELKSWTPRTWPCNGGRSVWARVTCGAGDRVTGLNLTSAYLVGEIPSDIGRLGALTSLLLSGNAFKGGVPSSFSSLSSLLVLRASLQEISGPVPEFLSRLTSLRVIEFQGNRLTGRIPPGLSVLTALAELNFAGNLLTGKLPDLGSLSRLRTLALSANGLSGKLPAWIGQLPRLQLLGLRENKFEGRIPDLSGLTALKKLYLSSNFLSGPIPDSLSALSSLEFLYLSQNNLNGQLPDEVFNGMTKLSQIDLSFNQFVTGPLPSSLRALKRLEFLAVSGCKFTGTLPDTLSELTSLNGLYLDNNALVGSLPSSLGSLGALTQLFLSSNTFEDTIPESLCSLTNLLALDLGSNVLNGTIPGCLVDMPKLSTLVVARNQLTGSLPSPVPSSLRFSFQYNCLTNAAQQNENCAPAWYSYQAAPWLWAVIALAAAILLVLGILALYANRDKLGLKKGVSFGMPRVDMQSFGGGGRGTGAAGEGATWGGALGGAGGGHTREVPKGGTTEFTLVEVEEATRSFTTLQGRDSYGNVYMGMGLLSGHGPQSYRVIVKRATNSEILDLSEREFRSRAGALAAVRHRYLVTLIGLCASHQERILVYEFLSNGSLLKRLHNRDEPALTWSARVKIGASLACALEFLHCRLDPPMTHGAVTSSNLLLASDMTAKLADLGLHADSRGGLLEPRGPGGDPRRTWGGLGFSSSADSETGHRGSGSASSFGNGLGGSGAGGASGGLAALDSLGVPDPDGVIGGGVPPEKADVYGFGVVILELITGQKVMKDVHITTMAKPFLDNPNVTQLMVDPQIGTLFNNSELMVLASVARSCIADDPLQRPSMKDVVRRMRDQMFLDPSLFQSEAEHSSAAGGRRSELAVSIPPTMFGSQRPRRGFEVLSPHEGAPTTTISSVDGAMYSIGIPRNHTPMQGIGETAAGFMPWNWGASKRSSRS